MFRKQMFLVALAVTAVMAPAEWLAAQNEPEKRQGGQEGRRRIGREEGQRGEGRRDGREGRRGRGRRRGRGMDQFYERLNQELELDENQKAQIEEIKAAQRQRMESFRQRRDEIRKAERDGNEELATQLREEMRAEREQNPGRRRGFMGETIQSIEEVLTDSQREKFTTLRETMRAERTQRMRDRMNERYDRIAEELQLDDDQIQVFEDVKAGQMQRMEEIGERWRAVRRAYEDGDDTLGDELREELMTEMREGGGRRQFMNQVYDELDPILSEEQRITAAEMRERRGRRDQERRERRAAAETEAGEAASAEANAAAALNGEATGTSGSASGARASEGDDVATMLEFTEEQKVGYAAMLKARNQKRTAMTAQMDNLQAQIAAAEASGDAEQLEILQAKLAQTEALAAQMDQAFDQKVSELLTDDQKAQYADYRAEQQVTEDLNDISADLRTVLRAAMKLKLDRSQKQQVRDISKQVRKDLRKARATDKKNRDRQRTAEKALANKVKRRIRNMLTTEQSLKYTETLKKLQPKKRSTSQTREI